MSAKPKSNHAKSVQYRARKQAADRLDGRLLTRAVLYRCPNAAWPDLDKRFFNEEGRRYNSLEFARLEFSHVASEFDEHTRGDNSDDTIEN